VIRGDDHVNNTPRQINILKALNAVVPEYAHLSMILGDDGLKLSKRRNSVAVTDFDEKGYLPEAIINYLGRLGWSHGDDEVFSREQFVEWFDLDHITPSAAQFNTEKLNWLNAHYIKQMTPEALAEVMVKRLAKRGVETAAGPSLRDVVALYQERASTLVELADAIEPFYRKVEAAEELKTQHLTEAAESALVVLREKLAVTEWKKEELNAIIKATCKELGMKMPQVAIPLRVKLLGVAHTPSIDAVLEVLGRDTVLGRLA